MAVTAPLCVALLAAAAPWGGPPQSNAAPVRYAFLPARNLSGDPAAPAEVFGRLERALADRGAQFVPPQELEEFLHRKRIRYTDSLSPADARALGLATQADFVLAGTLVDYLPGLEPRVAFALRAISTGDGQRVQSCVVALRGVDFEGLLGLGRIEDVATLAEVASERALVCFDENAAPRPAPGRAPGQRRGRPPDEGWGFVLDDFDPAAVDTVAVLPLVNRTPQSNASTEFAEFLSDAWFHQGDVRVVENGELRGAMASLRIRSMQFVDLEKLAQIGELVGARYFVLGSITRLGDEVLIEDDHFPEVEASVQLVDAELGRVVAAAGVRRRGDHYHSVLGLGIVRDPLLLAARTAREIVVALGG